MCGLCGLWLGCVWTVWAVRGLCGLCVGCVWAVWAVCKLCTQWGLCGLCGWEQAWVAPVGAASLV